MGVPSHVVGVATLLLLSGCVDTFHISPEQLQYLNGYSIHREQTTQGATYTDVPFRLVTTDGQAVDYNSTKQLILLGASNVQLSPPGPFDVINISNDTFNAVPVLGPPVKVPLKDIQAVQISQANPEATNQVIVLVTTIFTLLLTGIALAAH